MILVLGIFTSGCENREAEEKTIHTYFDLKGLIENKIVYLNERKPKVTKTIILNGKKEVSSTTKIDWKKELELFVQADINKPAFKNSYSTIKKSAAELEYVIKNGEDLNVRSLRIKMDTLQKQPYSIQALIKSENKIYKSEKYIELTFSNKNNEWQPVSYSVKGYQKLLMMDPKSFDIAAKIGL
ncbi:hypothetical protein [Dyadobacter sediminis]|nr:hypothetical protein [Dyadobacter sediminis]GGC07899.1 hypothetical protein GCM10011325_38530 [Dyadobacter sediminis]